MFTKRGTIIGKDTVRVHVVYIYKYIIKVKRSPHYKNDHKG